MPVMAYSPLEIGPLDRSAALRKIATKRGVSIPQVALAWLMRQPGVIVIPKASREEHVRENRAAHDIGLSPEELAEIDAASPPPQRATPLEMI